jgi:anti-sigma factor RsiW
LPLFFDGELEARQMRAVALHSTRCTSCEEELRELEHLQEAVVSHVSALVDEIDLGRVWAGVAPRLTHRAPSLPARVRNWWAEHRPSWGIRGAAFAAAAAAAMFAGIVIQRTPEAPPPQVAHVAKIDNSAKLDSMQSSVDSVALVTEAETNTTLLWIMDDATGSVEHVADDAWDSLQ